MALDMVRIGYPWRDLRRLTEESDGDEVEPTVMKHADKL